MLFDILKRHFHFIFLPLHQEYQENLEIQLCQVGPIKDKHKAVIQFVIRFRSHRLVSQLWVNVGLELHVFFSHKKFVYNKTKITINTRFLIHFMELWCSSLIMCLLTSAKLQLLIQLLMPESQCTQCTVNNYGN